MNTTIRPAPGPALAPDNSHLVLPRHAAACTGLLNRLSDAWWERRLGIETTGRKQIEFADAERYEPVPYAVLERILDRLTLPASAVIVDIGSGKGRPVCLAAQRPVREVIGVEIDPALHAIAEGNARKLRGRRTSIRLICASATDFDFRTVTTVLLFNPFGGETMRRVLEHLGNSWREFPRRIEIAYFNATCGHHFAAEPWLELFDQWPMEPWSRLRSPVQFYRTR